MASCSSGMIVTGALSAAQVSAYIAPVAADGDSVLVQVEAHLLTALGEDSGRASVSFLGSERIDVIRFGPDPEGLTTYVTLGLSRAAMLDPAACEVPDAGPRAELVLQVRAVVDSVLRRMAVLAASPIVEGVVISPGAGLDLQEQLWDGAPYAGVLVGEAAGPVPDLDPDDGGEPVHFLPLLPATRTELAWKRVHGAAALEERWLLAGVDPRDPTRRAVDLS